MTELSLLASILAEEDLPEFSLADAKNFEFEVDQNFEN